MVEKALTQVLLQLLLDMVVAVVAQVTGPALVQVQAQAEY
jgi:hypothetical protein